MHFALSLPTSIPNLWLAFPCNPCFRVNLSQPNFSSFHPLFLCHLAWLLPFQVSTVKSQYTFVSNCSSQSLPFQQGLRSFWVQRDHLSLLYKPIEFSYYFCHLVHQHLPCIIYVSYNMLQFTTRARAISWTIFFTLLWISLRVGDLEEFTTVSVGVSNTLHCVQ